MRTTVIAVLLSVTSVVLSAPVSNKADLKSRLAAKGSAGEKGQKWIMPAVKKWIMPAREELQNDEKSITSDREEKRGDTKWIGTMTKRFPNSLYAEIFADEKSKISNEATAKTGRVKKFLANKRREALETSAEHAASASRRRKQFADDDPLAQLMKPEPDLASLQHRDWMHTAGIGGRQLNMKSSRMEDRDYLGAIGIGGREMADSSRLEDRDYLSAIGGRETGLEDRDYLSAIGGREMADSSSLEDRDYLSAIGGRETKSSRLEDRDYLGAIGIGGRETSKETKRSSLQDRDYLGAIGIGGREIWNEMSSRRLKDRDYLQAIGIGGRELLKTKKNEQDSGVEDRDYLDAVGIGNYPSAVKAKELREAESALDMDDRDYLDAIGAGSRNPFKLSSY